MYVRILYVSIAKPPSSPFHTTISCFQCFEDCVSSNIHVTCRNYYPSKIITSLINWPVSEPAQISQHLHFFPSHLPVSVSFYQCPWHLTAAWHFFLSIHWHNELLQFVYLEYLSDASPSYDWLLQISPPNMCAKIKCQESNFPSSF